MEWKKLSQLVERKICYGIVQPGKGKNGNIPVIKVNNIISGLKSITELDTTTHEIASKFQRTQLFGGEIVVSVVGSVGNTAIVPSSFKGCNLVRATAMVDIKDKVLATYVMYYFKTHEAQKYIESRLNTTVQATLNIKDLEEMPIPILQSSIILRLVSILSALDAKIENNNKINANLEAQAEALFKSWFVDFTPFKDQPFVDSELGPIPQGWKVGKLTDIAVYLNGLAMQKFPPQDIKDSFPVLKIKELGAGICDNSSDRCSNKVPKKYIIEDGDIIFSWSGTLMVDVWCGGQCGLNQHLFKVSSSNYPKWFYYHWTKKHLRDFIHIARDKAVTMGHIKRGHLDNALVVVPNNFILEKATHLFEPLLNMVISKRIENQRLAALRDTLLPKLMSGEIKL